MLYKGAQRQSNKGYPKPKLDSKRAKMYVIRKLHKEYFTVIHILTE